MSRNRFPVLIILTALTAPPAARAQDAEAPRTATVDARGATTVEITARSGLLRVRGVAGLTEVRVRGIARASHEEWLEEIRLVAERRGDAVVVEARIPTRSCVGMCWGNHVNALDLEIDVPKGIAMRVDDSSGEIIIAGVGALELDDRSGSIEIEDVSGRVRVNDASGDIQISHVTGDVYVEDNSGGIDIRDVTGSVEVGDDSSGDIEIARVSGSVRVRDDSSGEIDVRDVGRDFTVDHDTSGGIRYRDVKGRVDIPEPRRRRRAS